MLPRYLLKATLSAEEIERRHDYTRDLLWKAGAHCVDDSIEDIEAVIADINARITRGEKP